MRDFNQNAFSGLAAKIGMVVLLVFCFALLNSNSYSQTIIAIQDFEATPATPTLAFTATGTGGSISTGQNPSTGNPASANLFASGERGFQTINGTTVLTFANQSLAGFTNNFVDFRLAGMSINSTNGIDTLDNVTLAVSLDGGATFSNEVRISGSTANRTFDFTATGASTTTFDGDNNPTLVMTTSGMAGISTVTLNLPSTATQVQIRITLLNNDANERFVIDNVRILGTAVPRTAALVNVGGRVTDSKGRGVSKALVTMTDGNGNRHSTNTDSLGYYLFEEVEVGQTLIFDVQAKRYNFTQPTQVVSLTEEVITVNFTGYTSKRLF